MRLSTFFILAGIVIISFYFLIDVSFYASQIEIENNTTTPVVVIPSIDVVQKINNKSVAYGVYHEPYSKEPANGTVILFGHRTLYGSPFLKLDQLQKGNLVFLDWPEIGRVEYVVNKSFIVPASYRISVDQGEKLFLITCHPLGSTKERLIVETDLVRILPLKKITQENPQNYYALIMILGFLIGGLILTYFYPVQEDKKIVLFMVIGLTLFLFLGYLFPIPADFISNKLSDINNLLGI